DGTAMVICVPSLLTVNCVTAARLNFTAVAPVKFRPLITIVSPGNGADGVILVIFGATLKTPVLVALPDGFVTLIFPVVAPIGTLTLMEPALITVGAPALVPLKLTSETVSRFVPEIVTVVPTAPEPGESKVIVGGLITMNA